jgi:hypothetical protein
MAQQQAPKPRMLRGDEAQLYHDHSAALRAAVRHFAHANDEVVDDACSFAWLQLLRHQPNRGTVFAWLRTVAIREAWRICERDARDRTIEDLRAEDEPRRGDLSRETEARSIAREPTIPASSMTTTDPFAIPLSLRVPARRQRLTRQPRVEATPRRISASGQANDYAVTARPSAQIGPQAPRHTRLSPRKRPAFAGLSC